MLVVVEYSVQKETAQSGIDGTIQISCMYVCISFFLLSICHYVCTCLSDNQSMDLAGPIQRIVWVSLAELGLGCWCSHEHVDITGYQLKVTV